MKTPVVIRKDYIMYLEFFDNLLWFHTDVYKWTSAVKKRFLDDMKTLVGLIEMPLLALIEESNKKLMKFAELIGMKKEQSVIANTGEQAFIYCWR
jgi:hypothetical protein